MRAIIINDIYTTLKQKATYVALLVFLGMGFITGFKFNISVGEGLAANAPYSVGFMIGLMSLTIIFIATVLAFSVLFKEKDANFSFIIYSTPIKNNTFALARFSSFYLLTLFGFFVLILGYVIGLQYQTKAIMNSGFNVWYYLYPFLVFGAVNALMVCSILFLISQKFKNKLLVAIAGLLLYVLYMIALMFSNAPFMAQSLPQSLFVQRMSAIVDLFGISGYFFEGKDLSVLQRNSQVVPLFNYLLLNRLVFILLSLGMVLLGVRSYSFLPTYKKSSKKQLPSVLEEGLINIPFSRTATLFNHKMRWQAIISFIKTDIIYILKSIPFVAVCVLLLFYLGVEMYDDIDKGIRLPQLYASSGLLSQTINSTFYFLGALVVVYFVNDIYWRSEASGFSIIESTTYYASEKHMGLIGSIALLILILTCLLFFEAIVYQILFNYFIFDWKAYFGVFVFNALPLMLLSLVLLFVNRVSKNKSIALGISILCFLIFATPIARSVVDNSLFRFLSNYSGAYSEFLGYGSYLYLFLYRLVFGFSLIAVLFLIYNLIKSKSFTIAKSVGLSVCFIIAFVSGNHYLKGYIPKDAEAVRIENVNYEKAFRSYKSIPQPTIKSVTTNIDLYPKEQSYNIQGHYIIINIHENAIDSVLISVPEGFQINSLVYHCKNETINIKKPISELILKQAIFPKDSARLEFDLTYKWKAVNGHNPFNAIVENGSFMRISRYFPQFGYDSGREITDANLRKKHNLGNMTVVKPLEAPEVSVDDFIDLDMVISTPMSQVAVGTGELKKQWQDGERNYYRYKAENIPFRFAVSSGKYQVKKVNYKGIEIAVMHHPSHDKNVDYLIENTKLTLDYCISNFGPYPFDAVTYAEVSSFTQGFAGTAYPGVIFMTENMIFNVNLDGEHNQDVINELAGHEVAHFWWGTNQIEPDYREGFSILTESLAMYTEMMIYKEKHGREKMEERVAMHQQIYDAEKGFYEATPLLRVREGQNYLAYSKGAVVFVELSKLLGEDKLNLALKNFLLYQKYPKKPTALDLLDEIDKVVSNDSVKARIEALFNEI